MFNRSARLFLGMLISVLLMAGCGNVEADADNQKYVYQYTDPRDGTERQLSIDYYDEFTYSTEEYLDVVVSECTPDWGIKISFSGEENTDYLYFYRCLGKGYELYKEYADEHKEVVQAGDYKVVLIDTEDGIAGYSSMGTNAYQGILLYMSKERWEELSDTIIQIIASAEYH